jgi:hypothetical protein
MARLYWTDDRPDTGWTILRSDDGATWNAEQIAGPGVQSATSLPALLTKVAGEDTAMQRRYTEADVRQALPAGTDAAAVVAALRKTQ